MNINFLVHLFHIIIVGGLFLYVGINREKIPKPLFSVLLGLGMLIILYHIFKVYKYLKEGEVWEINNVKKLHSVSNKGNSDRIHLLLDWDPNL